MLTGESYGDGLRYWFTSNYSKNPDDKLCFKQIFKKDEWKNMPHLHFKGIKKSDLTEEVKGQQVTVGWKLSPGQEFGYVTGAGFAEN